MERITHGGGLKTNLEFVLLTPIFTRMHTTIGVLSVCINIDTYTEKNIRPSNESDVRLNDKIKRDDNQRGVVLSK